MSSSPRRRIEQAVATARTRLSALDPGRVRPELLDGVRVQAYGGDVELRTVATVGVQPPRQLVVSPFDPGTLGAIERGIRLAHPDLSPSPDGTVLRVSVPAASEQRRTELARTARTLAEDARISVRLARQDALNDLKRKEKSGEITAAKRGGRTKDIQRLTDEAVASIEETLKATLEVLAR